MEIAIIGLPQSGKTTLFNALTGGHAEATGAGGAGAQMHVGVVKVDDPRLEVLARMYNPKKVVYPEIKYWDLPAFEPSARSQASSGPSSGSFNLEGQSRNILQGADAFLVAVRDFNDPAVVHPSGSVDPGRDLRSVLEDLTLADLVVLERVLERLDGGVMKAPTAERPAMQRKLEIVKKVKQAIEDGVPLRRQQLTASESVLLAEYQLLTGKPVIAAFNADESRDAGEDVSLEALGLEPADAETVGSVCLCAKLEADLALMSVEEAGEFRRELGLVESAMAKVVRVTYDTVGLVSFLTVGEDEVRAWSIPSGLPAQEAAGTIHTDFSRGFIRAEVIPYDDLVRCGSIAQGRKEGVLRSEGKTYGVRDGDVINFLINV
ncbi:MAG: redox-regulated ATPase YchF [Chloroflexi bacterium]|nr:redox-regulated ATPase YchF [Chloroflexota bacterium]